jgi:hypothetical protein
MKEKSKILKNPQVNCNPDPDPNPEPMTKFCPNPDPKPKSKCQSRRALCDISNYTSNPCKHGCIGLKLAGDTQGALPGGSPQSLTYEIV